ncbi:MAG: hypothetical protein AAGI15_11625 [Pseudomonadota bacterium]
MSSPLTVRLILLAIAAAGCALAWHGGLDRAAATQADTLLSRALTTYAVARSLNAAISVAQGTEIAVAPAGVGVTITAGEILDPLNDLIERFSWLVLMASASLGTQLVLTDIFAAPALTIALTVLLGLGAVALFLPQFPGRTVLLRLCALALFARFLFAVVTLGATVASDQFLQERQASALASLEAVTSAVEATAPAAAADLQTGAAPEDASWLDRFSRFMGEQAERLQIDERLQGLKDRAEQGIADMINLIVVFTLQTVLFPAAAFYLALRLFRLAWDVFLQRTSPQQLERVPAQRS